MTMNVVFLVVFVALVLPRSLCLMGVTHGPTLEVTRSEHETRIHITNHDLPQLLIPDGPEFDHSLEANMQRQTFREQMVTLELTIGDSDVVNDAIGDMFGNWYVVGKISKVLPSGNLVDPDCVQTDDKSCERNRHNSFTNPHEFLLIIPPLMYFDKGAIFSKVNNPAYRINDDISSFVGAAEKVDVVCNTRDFRGPFRAMTNPTTGKEELAFAPPICDVLVTGTFTLTLTNGDVLNNLAFFAAETYSWHGLSGTLNEPNMKWSHGRMKADEIWVVRNKKEVGYINITKSYEIKRTDDGGTRAIALYTHSDFQLVASFDNTDAEVRSLRIAEVGGVYGWVVSVAGKLIHTLCEGFCVIMNNVMFDMNMIRHQFAGKQLYDAAIIFDETGDFEIYALADDAIHVIYNGRPPATLLNFSSLAGVPPKFTELSVTYNGFIAARAPLVGDQTADERVFWREWCGANSNERPQVMFLSLPDYEENPNNGRDCESRGRGDVTEIVYFAADAMGVVNFMSDPDSGWTTAFPDHGKTFVVINTTVNATSNSSMVLISNVTILSDQHSEHNWYYRYECIWNEQFVTRAIDHKTTDGPVRMKCPLPAAMDPKSLKSIHLTQISRKGSGVVTFRLRNWDFDHEFIDSAMGLYPPVVKGGLATIIVSIIVGAVVIVGALVFLVPCRSKPVEEWCGKALTNCVAMLTAPQDRAPETSKGPDDETTSRKSEKEDLLHQQVEVQPVQEVGKFDGDFGGLPLKKGSDHSDSLSDDDVSLVASDVTGKKVTPDEKDKEESDDDKPAEQKEDEDAALSRSRLGVCVTLLLVVVYVVGAVWSIENILNLYRLNLIYSEEDGRTLREEEKLVTIFITQNYNISERDPVVMRFSRQCYPPDDSNAFEISTEVKSINVTIPSLEEGGTAVMLTDYERLVYRKAKKELDLSFSPALKTVSAVRLEFTWIQIEKVGQTLTDGIISLLTSYFPILDVLLTSTPPRIVLALDKALVTRRQAVSEFTKRRFVVSIADQVAIRKYNRVPWTTCVLALLTLLGSLIAIRFPLLKALHSIHLAISPRFPYLIETLIFIVLLLTIGVQFYLNFIFFADTIEWHFPIVGARVMTFLLLFMMVWQAGFFDSCRDVRCSREWCCGCLREPFVTCCAYYRNCRCGICCYWVPSWCVFFVIAVLGTASYVVCAVFISLDFASPNELVQRLVRDFKDNGGVTLVYTGVFFDVVSFFWLMKAVIIWKCCKMTKYLSEKRLDNRIAPLGVEEGEDGEDGDDSLSSSHSSHLSDSEEDGVESAVATEEDYPDLVEVRTEGTGADGLVQVQTDFDDVVAAESQVDDVVEPGDLVQVETGLDDVVAAESQAVDDDVVEPVEAGDLVQVQSRVSDGKAEDEQSD